MPSLRKALLACSWLFAGLAIARADAPRGADQDRVLARFEGGSITEREFQAALANKVPFVRASIAAPGGRERFLRELVDWELLLREAERRGYGEHLLVHDAAASAAIDALIAHDLTPDPASIPRAEVEQRHRADETKFRSPRMRHACHIELATEAEARALAAALAGASRPQFARAALTRSLDARTRRQGGELGWFTREGRGDAGQAVGVPPELVAAAFAVARANGVEPEPVRHGDRFSVLMVTGEKIETTTSIEQAAASIRATLATEAAQRARAALLSELEAAQKPAVLRPELLSLVAPATALPDLPSGFPAAPPDPRAPSRIAKDEDDGP